MRKEQCYSKNGSPASYHLGTTKPITLSISQEKACKLDLLSGPLPDGLLNRCMCKFGPSPTCGRILAYCKDQVTSFRERTGGIRLCVFKIGVTADPVSRYQLYLKMGFTAMWLIAASNSVDLVHMLEAALVSEFHQHVGCRNKGGSGGEGALNRTPCAPPPYYVYVTGGRADQPRAVG